MALAGPVSEWIGVATTFLLAGLVPTLLAPIAIGAARLRADELAHPLDDTVPVPEEVPSLDPDPR
jgi:hypothetical protein